jgi:hypothetical protein
VFDKHGKVIAVSNQSDSRFVGRVLNDEFVRQVLSAKDTAKYSVSSFSKTPMYGDTETYIYGATILSLDFSEVVGGIGIVFALLHNLVLC